MKIAILSDIHGNLIALNAVLKDLEKSTVDEIFCLGDLAMAGPEPNETIDFVKKQNWTIVQGNTDKLIVDCSLNNLTMDKTIAPIMANALENDVKIISKENINFLANLPEKLSLEREGVKILLVHGSPRRNNENIFPDLTNEQIDEIIADVKENIVFCGHTHIPCGYQTDKGITVVNDGSIGRPFTKNPDACYVLAEFNNGTFTIEHKFVSYNKEKASEILLKRDFEGAEKLAGMLIKPTVRHM